MVLTVGLQIAREGQRRWSRLSDRERDSVVRLVRKSKGRVTSITPGERAELRRLVWKALGPDR